MLRIGILGLLSLFLVADIVDAAPFRTPPVVIHKEVMDFSATPSVLLTANPTIISLKQAKTLVDEQSVLIIDARTQATYQYGHIPGARLATIAEPDTLGWLNQLSLSTPVMLYCGSKTCKLSSKLAKYMSELGYKRIYLFEGGYEDWVLANYSLER